MLALRQRDLLHVGEPCGAPERDDLLPLPERARVAQTPDVEALHKHRGSSGVVRIGVRQHQRVKAPDPGPGELSPGVHG